MLMLLAGSVTADVDVGTSVAAATNGKPVPEKLFSKSRRLEEGDDDEEEEYEFLGDYTIKFLSCKAGESWVNADGEKEYGSVVYRLCPNNGDCDTDCQDGYGDYVVGINTFVKEYQESINEEERRRLEDGEEEEDEFDVGRYAECDELELEEEDEEEEEGEDRKKRRRRLDDNGAQYYIGPNCTDDGLDVRFQLYTNEYCTVQASDVSYYDLAGESLPYSSGGLVDASSCTNCYGQNDDGEYELNDFCVNNYEDAYKCESFMESYSANGKDESYCDNISALMYVEPEKKSKAFVWFLVLAAVGGVAFLVTRKRKTSAQKEEAAVNEATESSKSSGLLA